MLEIKSLKGATFKDIADVFNDAFSDYYFPIHFTAAQFEEKFDSENGVKELSVGVFDNGKFVGFILHFFDEIDGEKLIYNGGTGVIPSHRGQGLTIRMYDFIIPILRDKGIDRMIHEVLSVNAPAIKVYEQVGFQQVRVLECYKGILTIDRVDSNYRIEEIEAYDWKLFQSFWDYPPTWQNSILALDNLINDNLCLGIFSESQLLGYIIFKPTGNRINQLAIHKDYRNLGLSKLLLCEIAERAHGQPVVTINVDSRLKYMNTLFENSGMKQFIQQFEMEMHLK